MMEVLYNITLTSNMSNATDLFIQPSRALLVTVLMLFAFFITIANAFVLACLFMSKHALKNFVNIQILSLSITDMAVGILAIPVTLTLEIISALPYIEMCAAIFYSYAVAQTANLFHAFGICLHRLVTIKRHTTSKSVEYSKHKFKWLLCEILFIWIASATIIGLPFILYGRFGERLVHCSFDTVFGDSHKKGVIFMNMTFLTPQIGMTVIYLYMFRFLYTTWRRRNFGRDACLLPATGTRNTEKESESQFLRKDTSTTATATTTSTVSNDNHRLPLRTNSALSTSDSDKSTQVNLLTVSTLTEPLTSTVTEAQQSVYAEITKCHDLVPEEMKQKINSNEKVLTSIEPMDEGRSAMYLKYGENQTLSTNPSASLKERDKDDISVLPNTQNTIQIYPESSSRRYKNQRDVLITIGLILLVTNICMTPLNLTMLYEILSDAQVDRRIRFGMVALSLMNSALNPFIYALRIKPFKEALKDNIDRFVTMFYVCK